MLHATFQPADLTTFCRLDELGLTAIGQRFEPERVVLECRVNEPAPWCCRCGAEGHPAIPSRAARACALRASRDEARDRPPHRLRVLQGVSSQTANAAILNAGKQRINNPTRFNGGHHDRRRRACMAAHPPLREVCDRDHRSHPGAREAWTGKAAGYGRRALETTVLQMARCENLGLAQTDRCRRDYRSRRHTSSRNYTTQRDAAYDKLAVTYRAGVVIAAILTWLRI